MLNKRSERALIAGMLVDAIGSGMYVPFSLIFFQRVTGLSLAVIGAVLTVAGFVGMAALPAAGAIVDRFGAQRTRQAVYLLRGVGFLAYPLGTSLGAFAAIATVSAAGERVFPAIQQALIGEVAKGEQRDRLMALTRSVRNGGMGAGGLLAAAVIAVAGDTGFVLAAWLNGASFFVAALLAARLKTIQQSNVVREKASYRSVLRDRPFAALTGANFLIALGYAALTMLLPTYVVSQFGLSVSMAGPLFAVNTALCAFAGVPLGRFTRRFARRTRAAAVGSMLFAAAFVGYAMLPSLPRQALTVGLFLLLGLYTAGELVHSPSAGALSVSAAPEIARGRYLATYQLSWALSSTVAPGLFTALLAIDGRLPWLALAVSSTLGAAVLVGLERKLPADAVHPVPPTAPAVAPARALAEVAR